MRAGTAAPAFAPGLAAGGLLLVVALVLRQATLGPALWLAGGSYVGFLAGLHPRLDATVPLVAAGLLLCGELTAWSLDERWRIRAEGRLAARRSAATALLALGGGALATAIVALAAVPPSHGIVLTLAGAVAAVCAAGTGIVLVRR